MCTCARLLDVGPSTKPRKTSLTLASDPLCLGIIIIISLRARQTVIGLQSAVNDANEEAIAEGGDSEGEGEGQGNDGGGGGGGEGRRGKGSGSLLRDLDVLEVSALDEVRRSVCGAVRAREVRPSVFEG